MTYEEGTDYLYERIISGMEQHLSVHPIMMRNEIETLVDALMLEAVKKMECMKDIEKLIEFANNFLFALQKLMVGKGQVL
jgi:hypothetical protein